MAVLLVFRKKNEFFLFEENSGLGQKNNTLVSGNVSDEKNIHSDGRKLIYFLINLIEFLK